MLSAEDISVPKGYQVDVFAKDLSSPINLIFTQNGDMLLADAGVSDGNGKVLKRIGNDFVTVAEGFTPPVTGINWFENHIFVSHRGTITIVKQNGKKQDILTGLPSHGDHHNNQVIFGPDGKMYFGQGTATNSGVVGEDNNWIQKYPFFHDYPGESIRLLGHNFVTKDVRLPAEDSARAHTGAYAPFGVPSNKNEKVKGIIPASGSVLRSNPDGSHLERVAWGLRNPFRMKFDRRGRLYATNHGMDERGSRPVANSPDEFQRICFGAWYGFPDFTGGAPVTLPQFRPEGKAQPSFLLAKHPSVPLAPLTVFPPHSAPMGFDFNDHPDFDATGNVFVAEYGPGRPAKKHTRGLGHRISKVDLKTGRIEVFAVNRSGYRATYTDGGGFERPIDVVFGPDGMYVVDMGINKAGEGFVPHTGVIWRIRRI